MKTMLLSRNVFIFCCAAFSTIVLTSCSSVDPLETVEKFKVNLISAEGILLDGEKPINFFYNETGQEGVNASQFLSSLSPKIYESRGISSSQVIVDMSAGMNVGIEKSYAAMSAILSRFTPEKTKYFHVDDNAKSVEPITEIKSLSDAAVLTNPANFKKQNSMLRPALIEATKSNDKVSIVITDFLLDEGIKGNKRLKNGSYTKEETADNSTWAKEQFASWFSQGNKVTIYPYNYSAVNYYKKSESKYIYYIIFEPRGAINSDLINLKNDLSSSGLFKNFVELDPSAITLNINDDIPGSCVENYATLSNPATKKALKVFPTLNAEHIPYSYPQLKKAAYADKPVACNIGVTNKSPFKVELAAEGFDASDYYYGALAISKKEWEDGKRPKDLVSSTDIACVISGDSAISVKLSTKVTGISYMSKHKGLAKLLLSKFNISKFTLLPIHESLSWNFESKEGTMENSALKESLRLALDEFITKNKNPQLGAVLISIHDK